MNTQSSTAQMQEIIRTDSDLTISGAIKLPTRDASGQRTLTPGEETVLLSYKDDVCNNQDAIDEAEKKLSLCEDERKVIGQQIAQKTIQYKEQKRVTEAEFEENKKRLEKLEHDNPVEDTVDNRPKPKQKTKKEGGRKMFSFVSIAFVAEIVTSLATINLQQETLSMDVILWRFAYIFVIYVFTCILYAKYLKTRLKAVKGLLIGTFLMSLACLLHAVILTFLNVDTTAPTAVAEFSLGAIEAVEAETGNGGLLANFVNNPGLIEFIIATLLVFAGEIITIDVKNNAASETTETIPSRPHNFDNVDYGAIAQANANRHKAQLESDQRKLLRVHGQRTALLDDFGAKLEKDLEDNKKREEGIRASLLLAKHKKEVMLVNRYNILARYRELLIDDLAIRLGVDASEIAYEPIQREDIEAYDRKCMQ